MIDRCLGRYVVANALREAGERVELHHDYFEAETPDDIWLPEVGARKWIVLTKDKHIRSNQIEIVSLLRANVYCFNLMTASATGPQMADAFKVALPDIKQLIARKQPPLIANVSSLGKVHRLLLHDSLIAKLRPPESVG